MAVTLSDVGVNLQSLLTGEAEQIAKETGFIQRQRDIKAAALAQGLVLGFAANPHATVEELADRIAPGTSYQGVAKRLREKECVDFFQGLLNAGVDKLMAARPEAIPLLRRFNGVYADDCSTISLPADAAKDFPGCGGSEASDGQAALKGFFRLNLSTGCWAQVFFQPGRRPDVEAGQAAGLLPAGAMRLADMGFFDLDLLKRDKEEGVYWITRVPVRVKVTGGGGQTRRVVDWLQDQSRGLIDRSVRLGDKQLEVRLIAWPCPEQVAAKRLARAEEKAKKKRRKVSPQQRLMCGWTVFITNVPGEVLRPDEVTVLYRTRWQIELLFKLLKNHGQVDKSHGRTGQRVLVDIYAKMLGMLIKFWVFLTQGGPLSRLSPTKAVRRIGQWIWRAWETLPDLQQLQTVLNRIANSLKGLAARPRRRKQRSTRQTLFQPKGYALS